jgi:hypothetical protein
LTSREERLGWTQLFSGVQSSLTSPDLQKRIAMAIHLGKDAVHPIEKSLAMKCILSPRTELLQVESLGSDSNFSPRDRLFSLRQSRLSPGATIHVSLPAASPAK